jgi:hypothetical protein
MIQPLRRDWDDYNANVLPKDAPPIQRSETRRAFYAGAYTMLCKVSEIGESHVSEDQGVSTLESLKAECEAFYDQMNRGQA